MEAHLVRISPSRIIPTMSLVCELDGIMKSYLGPIYMRDLINNNTRETNLLSKLLVTS